MNNYSDFGDMHGGRYSEPGYFGNDKKHHKNRSYKHKHDNEIELEFNFDDFS